MKIKSFVLALALLITSSAKAGDIATESTQIANGGLMAIVMTASNLIKNAQEAIRDIEELQKRVLSDDFVVGLIPGMDDIVNLLNQVEQVIADGQALAHTSAGLEDKMKERFRSYEDYLVDLARGAATLPDGTLILNADGESVDGMSRVAYNERFKTWSATHDETIRNILEAHGLQAGQFDTEKARFETLQTMSRDSRGRMQALQVGNEIANENLLQLQKLREIIMEQSSLHASYFAKKRAMEAETSARATISNERLQVLDIEDGVRIGINGPSAFQ